MDKKFSEIEKNCSQENLNQDIRSDKSMGNKPPKTHKNNGDSDEKNLRQGSFYGDNEKSDTLQCGEGVEVVLQDGETLEELFLNGLKIIQSKKLYRFTSDAVMLTKFASAKKNERVADFCSGSGIVGLHFYALHERVVVSCDMFEIQSSLADMCRRTISINGLCNKFNVHNVALQDVGNEFNGAFTLILCNPPYEKAGAGAKSLTESDRIARHEEKICLEEITLIASKKLRYGGRLCMCHRADRLADLIFSMRQNNLEPKRIAYAGNKNKPPYLVFIEGVKGGKSGIKYEPFFEN